MSHDKTPEKPILNIKRLSEEMHRARQRHRYQDEIAELQNERDEERRKLRRKDVQHNREIELILKAITATTILPSVLPAVSTQSSMVILKTKRRDAIDAVIDEAIKTATAQGDYQSVFAEMVKMAASPNRPTPFIGTASKTGIPYLGSNGVKEYFTSRALKGRLKIREKNRP